MVSIEKRIFATGNDWTTPLSLLEVIGATATPACKHMSYVFVEEHKGFMCCNFFISLFFLFKIHIFRLPFIPC